MDERKITIIEGPPPTFEPAMEDWTLSLVEGPSLRQIAMTQVRALNGPALVERCYRAWHQGEPIHLEFRDVDGIIERVPIVAAHYAQIDDADVLRLWVAIDNPDVQVDFEFVDEDAAENEEDDAPDAIDWGDIDPSTLDFGIDDDDNADADDADEADDDDFLAGLGF